MSFQPRAHKGVLHHYASHLVAFEHAPPDGDDHAALHTLLFVPGLFDDLLTVPYTVPLAASLPPGWRLVQPSLSSSSIGWGTSSLGRDVRELAQCVAYLRSVRPPGAKVVLMGHSTGCQDAMHYLTSPRPEGEPSRPRIDGAVLQASCSDREALEMGVPDETLVKGVRIAQEWVRSGRGEDVLPKGMTGPMFSAPVTARRWLSLTSPAPGHEGEDDYFSSDLTDERLRTTFGRIGSSGTRLQILFSGNDQFVPAFVDKEKLVGRWTKIVQEGGGVVDEDSGVVKGADHSLQGATDEVVQDVIGRVLGCIRKVEKKENERL